MPEVLTSINLSGAISTRILNTNTGEKGNRLYPVGHDDFYGQHFLQLGSLGQLATLVLELPEKPSVERLLTNEPRRHDSFHWLEVQSQPRFDQIQAQFTNGEHFFEGPYFFGQIGWVDLPIEYFLSDTRAAWIAESCLQELGWEIDYPKQPGYIGPATSKIDNHRQFPIFGRT